MADENTTHSGTSGDEVRFDADAKLDAAAGGATGAQVEFEPADDLGASDAKRGAAQQLKDEASKFGAQAADRAREFAGQGKDRATSALDEVARLFQGAADDVDAKLGADYGKYARNAAEGITNFAETLRGKDVDALFDEAGDFVRKSPAIAVGTAAALGFVMARLIKSGIDAAGEATGTGAASTGTTGDTTTTGSTAN